MDIKLGKHGSVYSSEICNHLECVQVKKTIPPLPSARYIGAKGNLYNAEGFELNPASGAHILLLQLLSVG